MKHRSQRQPSKKPFVRARKSLGQNFLVDKNAVLRIIDSCQLKRDETVLEIGAGTGLLTREIAPRVKELIAVETDPRFCESLGQEFQGTNTRIIHADFLKLDVSAELPAGSKIKVLGNLPYYITTPIITQVIEHRQLYSELFLMVQLEFAQRMAAQPGSKEYGSFSCFAQYYTEPSMLFKIKNTSFKPKPKVDSCFARLKIRPDPLGPANTEELLFKIIRTSFQQRRKTLLNSLSVLFPKESIARTFEQAGIDPQRRAESVSLPEFLRLTQAFAPIEQMIQSQQS